MVKIAKTSVASTSKRTYVKKMGWENIKLNTKPLEQVRIVSANTIICLKKLFKQNQLEKLVELLSLFASTSLIATLIKKVKLNWSCITTLEN